MNDLKTESKPLHEQSLNHDSNLRIDSSELDISHLISVIWKGKFLIAGITFCFALIAYVASYLVVPTWTSTAVMTKPALSDLGNLHQLQQNIAALDLVSVQKDTEPSISESVYLKFTESLAAYDLKRLFWLQSDYYKLRAEKLTTEHEKAILLEELIKNIQFTAKDERKGTLDTIQLKAESAAEANQLLRDYIEMVNQLRADILQQQFAGNKTQSMRSLEESISILEQTAKTSFSNTLEKVKTDLESAQQAYTKLSGQADARAETLAQLQAKLEYLSETMQLLEASGPEYDPNLTSLRSQLALIQKQPQLDNTISSFQFLRTPQEPVKSDGPRRLFWAFLASLMGGFIGICTVLIRNTQRRI